MTRIVSLIPSATPTSAGEKPRWDTRAMAVLSRGLSPATPDQASAEPHHGSRHKIAGSRSRFVGGYGLRAWRGAGLIA